MKFRKFKPNSKAKKIKFKNKLKSIKNQQNKIKFLKEIKMKIKQKLIIKEIIKTKIIVKTEIITIINTEIIIEPNNIKASQELGTEINNMKKDQGIINPDKQ